jgi:hypothetical protein
MELSHLDSGRKPDAIVPDWNQIKLDYEAGSIPVRQIASREGVSDTAVHKRAKAEAWNASLRKPDEPALPGLQTDVQTDVQTTVQTAPLPTAEEIIQLIERAYATATNPDHPKDDFEWKPDKLPGPSPAVQLHLEGRESLPTIARTVSIEPHLARMAALSGRKLRGLRANDRSRCPVYLRQVRARQSVIDGGRVAQSPRPHAIQSSSSLRCASSRLWNAGSILNSSMAFHHAARIRRIYLR